MILESIDAAELTLSVAEAAQRLRVPREFDRSAFSSVEDELIRNIDCKMAAVRLPVNREGNVIRIGDMEVESNNLSYALGDSGEAFVFAVTLGMGVERMLTRLSKTGVSAHFIADALSSAFAEAAADRAQEILDRKAKTKKRFSPGYGDLPLEIQPKILEALKAEKLLGITLTDTLLMKPQKSITAIVGIENE
ncbi:MAG: hypothetical protein E7647_08730 [Ruminococcaceae bacterium]|nr:hypothetical protein [Oscillospiraceae bacterium]